MNNNPTILLVDDDPGILLTVGDRLDFEGYHVVRVSRGHEAMNRLSTLVPDLIILDIGLPDLSGFAVMHRLQGMAALHECPVLIFSGRPYLASFFEGLSVSSFLPKTTSPDIFLLTVRDLIRQRQASRHEITQRSLLLVENDADFREYCVRFFRTNGFLVHEADGVEPVTELAAQRQPNIILLKYMMPHHNGPVMATHLGTHPDTHHIPVVIYDETGIHKANITLPHVRALIPSSDAHVLLRTIHQIIGDN